MERKSFDRGHDVMVMETTVWPRLSSKCLRLRPARCPRLHAPRRRAGAFRGVVRVILGIRVFRSESWRFEGSMVRSSERARGRAMIHDMDAYYVYILCSTG